MWRCLYEESSAHIQQLHESSSILMSMKHTQKQQQNTKEINVNLHRKQYLIGENVWCFPIYWAGVTTSEII